MKASWIVVAVLLVLAALAAAYYLSTHAKSNEEGTRVDMISSNGTVTINVDIADTPQEQQQGLMHRASMDEDHGMLFIFNGDTPQSFWMKNTPLPLDMIFVDSGLAIVDINHNAKPNSENVFTSRQPCKYVVEVNGGFCEAHGIAIGDRIKIY